MPNDGDHPLSEALTDTAQKGAALAAVVMQVLSERERMRQPEGRDPFDRALTAADVPGNGQPTQLSGRARQDYLDTKRRWAPAFELGFANSDPRTAVGVWIEATRHAELYPSAREALPFANDRLRALDPAFMHQVEHRIDAGVGPFYALETTARNQLQLPEGRSIEAKLSAAELELERVRQDYAAEYQEASENDQVSRDIGGRGVPGPSDESLARAEANVKELEARLAEQHDAANDAELAGMGSDFSGGSWTADLDEEPDSHLSSYTIVGFNPALPSHDMPNHYETHVNLAAAADRALSLEDDGLRTVEIQDDLTGQPIPRSVWEGADLASAQAQAHARSLEGLSADETLAGQQAIGAAKDRPQTTHVDERVEGLTNSVERFQLAEGSHANAAHLVAASYPNSLESTMQATTKTPIQPVSKPNLIPAKTQRRSL